MTNEEVVRELNSEIYDNAKEEEMSFSWSTNGFTEIIEFEGIILWCSEDDDREWIEEINDYEPMLQFIKNQYNKLVDRLTKLKFKD